MRSHSLTSYSFLTAVSVLLLCTPIQGQSTSSIEGQVTDQNGAVVPGAEITVLSSAINIHRKAITDQGGRYQIASLPMADYHFKQYRSDSTGPLHSGQLQMEVEPDLRSAAFRFLPVFVLLSLERYCNLNH